MTGPAEVTRAAVEAQAAASGAELATPDGAARAFYRLLLALSRRTRKSILLQWDALDGQHLLDSWNAQARDRVLLELSTSQMTIAGAAGRYVDAVVAAQGERIADAELVPESLAGVASDGGDLDTLMVQPVLQVLGEVSAGIELPTAVSRGAAALDTIVATQVADAARAATETVQTATPAVAGYIRMLAPPSCGRCVILAGRHYRWSAGFERHPQCDCIHVPYAEAAGVDDLRTDPKAYFDSLSPADQNKYFGAAQAEAIRNGEDMAAVVNRARRRGGLARPRQRRGGRPMPGHLIEQAAGDRTRAVAQLAEHGFITTP